MIDRESPRDSDMLFAAALLGSLAAVAGPFFFTPFVPATDVAQHVAQVRLFVDQLAQPDPRYAISWLWPNNGVYLLLGALWAVLPPVAAGNVGFGLVLAAWVAATFVLARVRARPAAAAALASVFVFSPLANWGLLNFLSGWPAFVFFLLATLRGDGRPDDRRTLAALGAGALLLYSAHALWLAAGLGWFLLWTLVRRPPPAAMLRRALALLPASLLAALWYPQLHAFRSEAVSRVAPDWGVGILERLSPSQWAVAAFGARDLGPNLVVLACVMLWLLLGYLTRRGRYAQAVDTPLLLAASMFAAVFFLAPTYFLATLLFHSRWWPCALILLTLALPPPRVPPRFALAAALAVLAAWSGFTAFTWQRSAREELTGLKEALAAVPTDSRVLGLDYFCSSEWVAGCPYMQTFAYAQAIHGGSLSFSFTEHAVGLVRHREPRRTPWTIGTEWYADRAKSSDFQYFDVVLVRAKLDHHRQLSERQDIRPVTTSGAWRLYRVVQPRPASERW